MLYFSDLSGKRVVTDHGAVIGKLTDLIFHASANPIVTKLVVSSPSGNPYLIPIVYLQKLNSTITIGSTFTVESLAPQELYVNKNLLDQQIIDIRGNKIVRVNDVAIQDLPAQAGKPLLLTVSGVDIGFLGILRWFGADETMGRILRLMGKTLTSQFLSWADIQPLALSRGKVVLKKEERKLSQLRPEDLADHLETLSVRNVTRMLDLMDEALAVSVVENLNTSYQQNLFKQFTPERSAKIIERMDADEAVDILLALTDKRRAHIIAKLSSEKQHEVQTLLSLSNTPIGGLIIKKFFTAQTEETAMKLRTRIYNETDTFSSLFYIYALNAQKQLVGVASLHELLMQRNDTPLYRFMNPSLIVLHLTTPIEIAAKRMLKYHLEALPVIDDAKRIIGIVTINELDDWLVAKLSP